ncbi:MAG TPA: hypothetical protein VLV15_06110, partial [Dongiaceae bacterium]|nr:hypothetical protein [Dongiaceae bacterium]
MRSGSPRAVAPSLVLVSISVMVGAALAQSPTGMKPWHPAGPTTGTMMGRQHGDLPDSTVMIRFDGHPIRALDVVGAYFNGYPPDLPKSDSLGRVEFLR